MYGRVIFTYIAVLNGVTVNLHVSCMNITIMDGLGGVDMVLWGGEWKGPRRVKPSPVRKYFYS